jgi:hypothetical protein
MEREWEKVRGRRKARCHRASQIRALSPDLGQRHGVCTLLVLSMSNTSIVHDSIGYLSSLQDLSPDINRDFVLK